MWTSNEAQDRLHWPVRVNIVTKLQVPQKAVNFSVS